MGDCTIVKRYIIKKVIERFGMANAKLVSTPLAIHFRLSTEMSPKIVGEEEYMTRAPYTSVTSNSMYAMVCTCANIAQAVGTVSSYMSCPGKGH